jgi:hypothetical protein
MLDVARNRVHNMLTTRSQHTRNMYSLNVASITVATWEKLFATSQKLFATSLRLAKRSTADTLPDPNRAAQHPSDASAWVRRPAASSAVPQF